MYYIWETDEVHTGFWWGNLRGRDHLEDLDVDGRISRSGLGKAWTGLIWLRVKNGGRPLQMR